MERAANQPHRDDESQQYGSLFVDTTFIWGRNQTNFFEVLLWDFTVSTTFKPNFTPMAGTDREDYD
jgi:hypothetical protein